MVRCLKSTAPLIKCCHGFSNPVNRLRFVLASLRPESQMARHRQPIAKKNSTTSSIERREETRSLDKKQLTHSCPRIFRPHRARQNPDNPFQETSFSNSKCHHGPWPPLKRKTAICRHPFPVKSFVAKLELSVVRKCSSPCQMLPLNLTRHVNRIIFLSTPFLVESRMEKSR